MLSSLVRKGSTITQGMKCFLVHVITFIALFASSWHD